MQISFEPIKNYLHVWTRNFEIAFWVELLITQPVARFTMKKLHERQASGVEDVNLSYSRSLKLNNWRIIVKLSGS